VLARVYTQVLRHFINAQPTGAGGTGMSSRYAELPCRPRSIVLPHVETDHACRPEMVTILSYMGWWIVDERREKSVLLANPGHSPTASKLRPR